MNKLKGLFGQLNQETQEHSIRVASICAYLAKKLGTDEIKAYKIGYVHDFGKIYIPSRIIKKSEELTELEREIIDMHSYYGYKMLKDIGEAAEIYVPVLFHHGFLKPRTNEVKVDITDEILNDIKILHSADVFDAMTNKRVYHEPFPKSMVFEELRKDVLCNDNIIDFLRSYEGDLYRNAFSA